MNAYLISDVILQETLGQLRGHKLCMVWLLLLFSLHSDLQDLLYPPSSADMRKGKIVRVPNFRRISAVICLLLNKSLLSA